MQKDRRTYKLVFGGLMLSLATVFSLIKITNLPFGGSVTFFSMVPLMLFSYLFGIKWGVFSGVIYGAIQLLLGGSVIKGFHVFSAIAMIALDYLFAFGMLGFSGLFRNKIRNPTLSFSLGSAVTGMLRYFCHITSGVIFFGEYATWFFGENRGIFGDWAFRHLDGFTFTLFYSIVYNGLYMIPEIVLSIIAVAFLSKIKTPMLKH